MNGQSNVITAERALKAVWHGARRIDRDALFAHDFRFRNLDDSNNVTDLRGLRIRLTHVRAAHPDGHLNVEEVFESGDHFVARWALRKDERTALSASRSKVSTALIEGTWVLYLCNGQVVEMWERGGQLVGVS